MKSRGGLGGPARADRARSRVECVARGLDCCRKNLAKSVQSQRKTAYRAQPCATGQSEPTPMSPETPRWPPLDEDGRLVWPTNHDQTVFLARRLLSQALVGSTDARKSCARCFGVVGPTRATPLSHSEGHSHSLVTVSARSCIFRQAHSSRPRLAAVAGAALCRKRLRVDRCGLTVPPCRR
jgi:hypothetical protein